MHIRRTTFFTLSSLALIACAHHSSGTAAAPSRTPTVFTVAGNQLLRNGVPDTLHGVNRPSCEWNPRCVRVGRDDFARMREWGVRMVRIPLNQGFMLPGAARYDGGYRARIRSVVRAAEDAGIDAVILDLHWNDRGHLADPKPGQQRMADSNSLAFWRIVASDYKDDGRVMLELYNEPHDIPWEVWQNGGAIPDVVHRDGTVDSGFVAVGMQQMYDAVRATGARNVVIIGGLDWAFDLSGVASHRIRGENIAYATHPYPTGNRQPPTWDRTFGDLSQTDLVIATEFGDNRAQCDTIYSSQFVQYARTRGLSWTAWAWYAPGDYAANPERFCHFPSVIRDWDGNPTPQGAIVKAAMRNHS